VSPFNRFLLALFFILFLIFSGTAGFMFIEGWTFDESLYMTYITISTVGFSEVHPLSVTGRKFMIIFLTISIITIGYTLTTLLSFIFEGQIVHTMKERRMKRILSLIKDHFIICGYGDVGRETAEEFYKKKVPFIIVDNNFSEADRDRDSKFTFIYGDATEENILEEAKISKAKGLVSCLSNDQQNVYTVLTARQLNNKLQIVAKDKDVKIAVLTVRSEIAQEVTDQVVASGIKTIWNFTQVKIKVPEDVLLLKEDLSSSYAVLSVYS